MILYLREITRKQRARVYSCALAESFSTFAFEEAQLAARRLGLGVADANRLAGDAVRYAIACHGLFDASCCRVANLRLAQGVIPSPRSVIRDARRVDRRTSARVGKSTSSSLAARLAQASNLMGAV